MKHGKFLLKIICFSLITMLLVSLVNYILMPKYYFDDDWPVTSVYKGFYQMEKDSVDVLFFGSSLGAAAFNPQVFYDRYGIRSYNLSCQQQSLFTSYYWLEEALRFQSPKVVVLDTYMLYTYRHKEPLNSEEAHLRKAMDVMKWSDVKRRAVKDIERLDARQTARSYLFTNIRFHARWKDLSEQDFTFREMERHFELKGFAPGKKKVASTIFSPIGEGDTDICEEPNAIMLTYLEQIANLCEDKGVELILAKTPMEGWDCSKHNTVARFAEERGLAFIDFNEKEVFDASGFVFTEDMDDSIHANIWGAEKVSAYLADSLKDREGLTGYEDARWSETADYYQRVKEDCSVMHIEDMLTYLDAIDKDRYTVFVAVRLDATAFMTEEVKAKFREIGLDVNMDQYDSYYGVISEGDVVQQRSQERLSYTGSIREGRTIFTVSSGGYNADASCSVKIDGAEYAINLNGINIVVYNNETRKVVDSVCYFGEMERQ